MDEQRMDVLYKQVQNMDSSLIDILDNYKKYSESTQPVVTVLCTDNKLRQDMDMFFSSRSDIIAKVYGTYNEQAKENEYNTLLSDVVVVCTKAKTISPKGLYDAVQAINKVNKPIYVLLAGWESLSKTPEMLKQRAERVKTEFMFARIVDVTNVFSKPANGMELYEDAVQSLCLHFKQNFKRLHADQDEALYKYVKAYVADYYTRARTEINNVISKLNDCECKVVAKQNYYKTKFIFLEVRFQEIVDKIKREIDDISYYDITDDSGDQTLSEIYKEGGSKAQTYAKKFIIEEMQRRIRQLDEKKDNFIRMSAESIVAECLSEMMGICDHVSKLKYISETDIVLLREICQNDDDISKIPIRYGEYMNVYLEEVIKRIPAKVKEYEYGMNSSIKVFDIGKKASKYAKDLISEKDDDYENPENSAPEKQDDNDDAMMINKFQNDVEGMIQNAQNSVLAMAQDCLRNIKKDIEQTCSDILKKYFEGIYKTLVTISANTEKTLSEFDME